MYFVRTLSNHIQLKNNSKVGHKIVKKTRQKLYFVVRDFARRAGILYGVVVFRIQAFSRPWIDDRLGNSYKYYLTRTKVRVIMYEVRFLLSGDRLNSYIDIRDTLCLYKPNYK